MRAHFCLAKVACGAFADKAYVAGRERRDFRGLRSGAMVKAELTGPRQKRNAAPAITSNCVKVEPRARIEHTPPNEPDAQNTDESVSVSVR